MFANNMLAKVSTGSLSRALWLYIWGVYFPSYSPSPEKCQAMVRRELFVWRTALNIKQVVHSDPNCSCLENLCWFCYDFIMNHLKLQRSKLWLKSRSEFHNTRYIYTHTSLCLFFKHLIKATWCFFSVQTPTAEMFLLISLGLLQCRGKPRQNIFLQKG